MAMDGDDLCSLTRSVMLVIFLFFFSELWWW